MTVWRRVRPAVVAGWIADVVAPLVLVAAVVVIGVFTGYPAWWVSLLAVAAIAVAGYFVVAWVIWPRSGRRTPGWQVARGDDDRAVRAAGLAGIAITVAAVAALAGVVVAAAGGVHRGDERIRDNRTELGQQVGPLVTQVFSYRRGHRAADRAAARSLVSGDFAVTYAVVPEGATDDRTVSWQPARVAIGKVGEQTASVTVAANITETGADNKSTTSRKVVVLQLNRASVGWQINAVEVVL